MGVACPYSCLELFLDYIKGERSASFPAFIIQLRES